MLLKIVCKDRDFLVGNVTIWQGKLGYYGIEKLRNWEILIFFVKLLCKKLRICIYNKKQAYEILLAFAYTRNDHGL